MLNKIKGALFGVAIGDALGGTTEFLTKEEIERRHGVLRDVSGGGCWGLEKGETTDDTAMTMAVAKGILQNPEEPIEAIGKEFLTWYDSRPKDIGIIISTVLGTFNGNWFETAKHAHFEYLNGMSAGNGSLMRCLPAALAYPSIEKVEEVTKQLSKMTHYDSLAEEACVIYNRIAFQVLHGQDLKEAIVAEIENTPYAAALLKEKPACTPDGFVVHTMMWVLYWLLNSETFSDVVIGAANEGYDTDTVAAIAGGLAGLQCGYEKLPLHFIDAILVKEELVELAKQLGHLQQNGNIV
ncbi:ADP-ribosylglycohydrolase family protein [Bacillus benzoevorans]|uniref:ADP-ribosyl-[dinitrogen reductase] hydrolase n=1 Tax=Bacillus benzoevorans TaxID=1456 RepID=A0A7X0LUU8_9BACI|nr:ADP-ribosylglycohydrolase family protein [Bacillus benzoevorans]MBB6445331.1 ADP-ribosyl-[dinitrogen reductase] hydrolase [Bacillus benzoevorans]